MCIKSALKIPGINPSKTTVNLNYIQRFSSYYAVNTFHLGYWLKWPKKHEKSKEDEGNNSCTRAMIKCSNIRYTNMDSGGSLLLPNCNWL